MPEWIAQTILGTGEETMKNLLVMPILLALSGCFMAEAGGVLAGSPWLSYGSSVLDGFDLVTDLAKGVGLKVEESDCPMGAAAGDCL